MNVTITSKSNNTRLDNLKFKRAPRFVLGLYLPNGFYKVPKVINPSSDNTGLSNCSLSNIILKRISLECDIAYQPNQTFGPKWSPHHILSKAKKG